MTCSCQLFTRTGLLCRHIFAVLKNNHIEEIPEKYILRRWRKDVISSHNLLNKHGFVEKGDEILKLISEAYENFEYCLDVVKGDEEKLVSVVESTRKMRKDVERFASKQITSDKNEEDALKLLGINSIPETVEIQVPSVIRNKGSGTKKRLISNSEKATGSKSSTRICTGCNLYVNHNARTCKVRIEREKQMNSKKN